jgi:hypothetical protein
MTKRKWVILGTAVAAVGVVGIVGLVVIVSNNPHESVKGPKMTVPDEISSLIKEYVRVRKNWGEGDYRIVPNFRQDDAENCFITVIHKDDEARDYPGGGKSIRLHVNLIQKKVIKEYLFQ